MDERLFLNTISYYNIIKCLIFESIYYTINLDVALSLKKISEFDFMFIYKCITSLNQ